MENTVAQSQVPAGDQYYDNDNYYINFLHSPCKIQNICRSVRTRLEASTDEPMASTDEPMASTDEPMASTDEPMASTDEPMASTDEPQGCRNSP